MKQHDYKAIITWTGNTGNGTADYRGYERSHEISIPGKPIIPASSDPSFRGDKSRYNPEEMLVASLSSCHMLWYLHLCSVAGVVVLEYSDEATGIMTETADGGGYFKEVTLRPKVTLADNTMIAKANELHHEANKKCFIANSVNFPVLHRPVCLAGK
ncbi:OsmC family protein [Mucilaginibacter sp. L3T2-6]|uniref:OsmC family protein n=1 Tax=Mucilaginibacter sp. L3T2-6 TaxID=3062491 RepID=UPI002674BF09|nr:OsmC family protein [Mucilaginibacter sp. L3T2-6]MDO3640907.1 OsmC family protein [Mucilaginibacter sp. L3T2-6]MDV6213617.1 OsmC family protein [Mucilaginibacter sp. L3T2-6]